MAGSRNKLVGVLPDGRHVVVTTKKKSEAFIAICDECGTHFDNDVPVGTISGGVASHAAGTGHVKTTYYALEVLADGRTLTLR